MLIKTSLNISLKYERKPHCFFAFLVILVTFLLRCAAQVSKLSVIYKRLRSTVLEKKHAKFSPPASTMEAPPGILDIAHFWPPSL